ncbi:hypothetical protein GGS20DRAFT_578586 [Poronia punctata]|nr:hypothetical protein GGS20DRAFT_578586 [Poronia punctata]
MTGLEAGTKELGDVWTAHTPQASRPRPATIYEGFSFCAGDEFGSMPSWETSSGLTTQTPSDIMSHPISMNQAFYPDVGMATNTWISKPCEDNLELPHFDGDMPIGQAFTTDEAIPVLDLRYPNTHVENDAMKLESGLKPRPISGSSFTVSTTGLSDMPPYEEFSTTLSEAPSHSSDYPPPSNRNSLMSSTQLSPVASPRMPPQSRTDLVRAQSRGRGASPSRSIVRSPPYNVENSARNKRWSTGSYATKSNRRPSPFVYHHTHDAFGGRMPSHHSSPTVSNNSLPLNFGNLQVMQQYQFLVSHPPPFQMLETRMPPTLPSNGFHTEPQHYEKPAPLVSHGMFRMLQSNADPHTLHGRYTDLSDPPDLFSSLQDEPVPPPPEDMNPSDPDLTPREQELRYEGDLYTPKWVRGHGNKREGWCGTCKPGRWLVLKNSAFWYDKCFAHGISPRTGNPFQGPQETRRMDGSPDAWEGLCSSCNDWIALVSSKKKGTTWFRHAYKCHTHPKIKDAPKRRRESSHSRNLAAPLATKPRIEQPMAPSHASNRISTPTPTPALTIVQHSTPKKSTKAHARKPILVPNAKNMI